MSILLTVITAIIIYLVSVRFYIKHRRSHFIKKTDKIITRYFNTTNIFEDRHYRIKAPLAVELGTRILVLKDIKVWQVRPIVSLLVSNGFDLASILENDKLFEAIAYLFSDSLASDRLPLVFDIANNMTAEQFNILIKAIIAKTNLLCTIKMISEVMSKNV